MSSSNFVICICVSNKHYLLLLLKNDIVANLLFQVPEMGAATPSLHLQELKMVLERIDKLRREIIAQYDKNIEEGSESNSYKFLCNTIEQDKFISAKTSITKSVDIYLVRQIQRLDGVELTIPMEFIYEDKSSATDQKKMTDNGTRIRNGPRNQSAGSHANYSNTLNPIFLTPESSKNSIHSRTKSGDSSLAYQSASFVLEPNDNSHVNNDSNMNSNSINQLGSLSIGDEAINVAKSPNTSKDNEVFNMDSSVLISYDSSVDGPLQGKFAATSESKLSNTSKVNENRNVVKKELTEGLIRDISVTESSNKIEKEAVVSEKPPICQLSMIQRVEMKKKLSEWAVQPVSFLGSVVKRNIDESVKTNIDFQRMKYVSVYSPNGTEFAALQVI